MSPVYVAVLRSWSVPPAATFALLLTALVYLRGWWLLRRARVPFLPPWRASAFLLGLFSLWVALASPMDVFNGFVLTAHMLQHMMLMMVAPPLVLLGAPLVPIVRGLPVFAAREFAGPFLNWPVAKRAGSALTNPIFALLLMGTVMFAWHTPALYELALRSSVWHQTEHACFFLTSLVFWWPVVQPWPSRALWPRWAMVPYLLIADLQNTVLSAILVFSDRVLYPSYSSVPRLFGLSALEDQVAAGAIMWVVGSIAFVVPAFIIAVQCLSKKTSLDAHAARNHEASESDSLPPFSQGLPFIFRSARARWGSERVDAFSFVVLFTVVSFCFAALLAGASDDDDQTLRFQETSGPFEVAILATAGDLAAGPSAFSVLVQNPSTQEVMLDTAIDLTVHSSAGMPREAATVHATAAGSGNKLLQIAELNLPAAGDWTLAVVLRRNAQAAEFALPLHVVKEDAGSGLPWPYITVFVVGAVLLVIYLRRRRESRIQCSTKGEALSRS